ncbi:MAG: hypothetical protein EA397_01110 [Deltaproteobacteria bacterium]|nr:MAG: hypothetical protein EA397_01110 [Deltaproteobacteria bacterium]
MRLTLSLLLLSSLSCTKTPPPAAPAPPPPACGLLEDGSRAFKILHLNDIYRIEGLADGRGGLARVRTLRTELERDCPGGVMITHAGDALFPSLLSRVFQGEQMIDVLNSLDGNPDAFDTLMFFTPGNHEFDKAKLKDSPMLQARIDESQFLWLDTNIAWADGDEGPLIGGDRLASNAVVEIGGVKVGLFGLTIDAKVPAYASMIDTDYESVARTQVASLRDDGAEIVIGLTHLDASDDRQIIERLGADGPDMILGGHDHSLQTSVVGTRPVLKGDADAVRVRVIEARIGPDGQLDLRYDDGDIALGPEAPAEDPLVQTRIETWLERFEETFCADDGPGCLDQVYTTAGVDLHAEETTIRRFETNLGGWIADRMVETFAEHGAQAAVINSGALRLNQDISAGTPITRQILEEIFAYPTKMSLIEISGETLQAVLDRSVEDWTAQGHWLQVSGVAFRHDTKAGAALQGSVLENDSWRPIDPQATYRVVTVDYLLDPNMGDQDGYTMLSFDAVVDNPINGTDLKPLVGEAWKALPEGQGFAPSQPGRVCNAKHPSGQACVLDGATP